MNPIHIRKAKFEEIDWINDTYQKLSFTVSDFNKEYIAVAEFNGYPCGLGRLVPIDSDNLELGGMYVSEEYRKKGIANAIVLNLIHQNKTNKNIWCLPFGHLKNFYEKFDFKEVKELSKKVPTEIFSKYEWCRKTYNKKVLLLVKNN
ncbi:GNAT family N-acetyltransferase [uncultured Aquimarina sp.]|uniref:GNAT family N-acetyltransferase n=1 Tax=uncultured Aquimarina sp. TaxID=575652 RepID=UPI002612A84A|nr:GNAT family N-acetyltransferase [uncultured Aquimarina sp.]